MPAGIARRTTPRLAARAPSNLPATVFGDMSPISHI